MYNWKKLEALSDCTFYKGEEECPEDVLLMDDFAGLFWRGEKLYTEVVEDCEMTKEIELFYENCGLEGADYTISHLLKACIFSELCRHSDSEPCDEAMFFYKTVLPRYLELVKRGISSSGRA